MAKNNNWTKNIVKSTTDWQSKVTIIENPEIPEEWNDDPKIKLCYICGGSYSAGAIRKNENSNIEIAVWDTRTKKLVKKLNLHKIDSEQLFFHLHNLYNSKIDELTRVFGVNSTYENIDFNRYKLNLTNIQKLDKPYQLLVSVIDEIVTKNQKDYVLEREKGIDLIKEQKEINSMFSFQNLAYRRSYILIPGNLKKAGLEVRVL